MADRDQSQPGIVSRQLGPLWRDGAPRGDRLKAVAKAGGIAAVATAAAVGMGDGAGMVIHDLASFHAAVPYLDSAGIAAAISTGAGGLATTFVAGGNWHDERTHVQRALRRVHTSCLALAIGVGTAAVGFGLESSGSPGRRVRRTLRRKAPDWSGWTFSKR